MKKLKRRYFQGRIVDNSVWQTKIVTICKKWLKKTPTVPAMDSGKGLYLKKKSIQVWQTGSLLLALAETGQDKLFLEEAKTLISREFCCDNITDSDFGLLGFALYIFPNNNFLETKIIKYVTENVLNDDIICYKSNVKSMTFVDTLGFICPFLTEYGIINRKFEFIELAKKQITNYLAKGVEPHCKLPFHAYDVNNETCLGICDWARGTAWLLIALMDSYICLQKNDIQDNFYLTKIKEYADIICALQKPSGAYSWQLLRDNDSDSSATAVFGWYFVNCYNFFGDKKYLDCARKCREYLKSVTFNNGAIDYCQGDTLSVGMYSRLFDIMPFGQAFALRMQTILKNFD